MPAKTQLLPQKKLNFDIEALRGFAAVFVIWHHAHIYPTLLAPGFTPTGILNYGPSGHFCVLLFFVLSGYVIGLSNKKPLIWATTPLYLKKRAVRLYPIFLVTLLLAIITIKQSVSLTTIIGNLALGQGLFANDINLPGWSLGYEVLYYLLFVFISIFRVNPYLCAALALLLGFINFALYPVLHTPIITSYCYGLVFWALGLAMSRWLSTAEEQKPAYHVLLSCLLFVLCIDQYNLVDTLLHKVTAMLGINPVFPSGIMWDQVAVYFYDLSYLPFALLIILIFTGKRVAYSLWMLRILFGISAINLLYVAKHAYSGDLNWSTYALPTGFFLTSLACLFVRNAWVEQVSRQLIQVGIWLGSLSYGIYLVHFPILFLFSRFPAQSGTWATFGLRFTLLLVLTLGASYWLEKVMQPRLKAFFFKDEMLAQPAPVFTKAES